MDTPLDRRDARIAELEAENAHLRAVQIELTAKLERALARIAQLERQLGLHSQNSSKPPSTDTLKERAERQKMNAQKKKKKRSAGGQKGHGGHHRTLWPIEKVDHIEQFFPSHCADCGLELSHKDASGTPFRRQVFEIPPKLIECTEYQGMTCLCPACGHKTRAALPAEVLKSGWGAGLVGLLAAFSAVTFHTRRGLNWFVSEVLGAPSSVGTIQKHLEEASQALEPGFEQANEAIRRATWVGVDETGWRKGRLPYWIWSRQTDEAAIYDIRRGRTKAVAQELLDEPGARVFVTDRYGAYSFLPAEHHQICHAHLLREFTQMAERDGPVGRIGKQLAALTRRFLTEFASTRSGVRERNGCVRWLREEVRPAWQNLLKEAAEYGRDAPAMVRWLLREENLGMAWVFLEHPRLQPTNNASERALRGPVIQRKISWGSQSEEGLRLMERLWTTAETCKRQRRSVLDYMTHAIRAFRAGTAAPVLIES